MIKQISSRLLSIQQKYSLGIKHVKYFTKRQWHFVTSNASELADSLSPADRLLFDFDPIHIQWYSYLEANVLGIRQYFHKEPPESLKDARRTMRMWVFTIIKEWTSDYAMSMWPTNTNIVRKFYRIVENDVTILFIKQAVQCFNIFLRQFDNYIIFFLQFPLSFQSSSINPFSPISPLIPSAQVSLGLPHFLLPGGLHFMTSFSNFPSSILWTCSYH